MSAEPSGASKRVSGNVADYSNRDSTHSRRQYYGETSASINSKVLAAVHNNIKPIYCIGETLEERENNKTLDVVKLQIQEGLANYPLTEVDNLVLAYEPVWAIGTGKTATDEMAQEVHSYVRSLLVDLFGDTAGSSVRILYGVSMKRKCIGFIISTDVDGGLIGGARGYKIVLCNVDSSINAWCLPRTHPR